MAFSPLVESFGNQPYQVLDMDHYANSENTTRSFHLGILTILSLGNKIFEHLSGHAPEIVYTKETRENNQASWLREYGFSQGLYFTHLLLHYSCGRCYVYGSCWSSGGTGDVIRNKIWFLTSER